MANTQTNPKVDAFIERAKQWREETEKLRALALSCGLTEELKWGKPCYALDGKNIVLIQGFKEFVALLFFKGTLLKDPDGILSNVGENSQSARQIRFKSPQEVDQLKSAINAYIEEAIAIEKAGLTVELKKTSDFEVAPEFQAKLDSDAALKMAFESLTPGRQRAYLLHFAGAKQSATRASRVEKCTPHIMAGKGLTD